jgi:GNAT superfamily N-acetyltransferase
VLAATHLLRYGEGEGVGEHFRAAGEVGWLLCVPDHPEAAAALLFEARGTLASWGVRREEVCSGGLPVPAFGGVPDRWPHVAEALEAAGYGAGSEHREALYGGTLARVPEPSVPLLPGLELKRSPGQFGVRFSAVRGGEEIGRLECAPDLTEGGNLPALDGWAELAELWVREGNRGRGVGGWLVGHAAGWLRLAGCDRVVICVDEDDEAAGAGRFYRRFGWEVLARLIRSWEPR